MTAATGLQARALTCVRGDEVIFEGLDLTVTRGEILQVEGDNGSGKTSLLRILCGLATPAEGSVYWNGAAITALGDAYTGQLCYIGHLNGISAELTPLENLVFAASLSTVRATVTPETVLRRVGLGEQLHLPTRYLSAGQRRRVALARLLVNPASLWILDEPFTALDASGKTLVEGLLEEHASAGGLAIVATHQTLHTPTAAMAHFRFAG